MPRASRRPAGRRGCGAPRSCLLSSWRSKPRQARCGGHTSRRPSLGPPARVTRRCSSSDTRHRTSSPTSPSTPSASPTTGRRPSLAETAPPTSATRTASSTRCAMRTATPRSRRARSAPTTSRPPSRAPRPSPQACWRWPLAAAASGSGGAEQHGAPRVDPTASLLGPRGKTSAHTRGYLQWSGQGERSKKKKKKKKKKY
mmetsp:Transcript_64182/g.128878  ORF Transcript_64182/g.128878 Transcript_64182/m.128878 type:complete len:200 (-) Transcript_64182:14-613(-)